LAYIHLLPLRPDRLRAFLHGEIRGWQITADDLDPFEPGKEVDVLLTSIGATRAFGEEKSLHYAQHLLRGTRRALAELGRQGIIIRKIYATSETKTGINLAMHANMKTIWRVSAKRYAFELDVASSDFSLLKPYREAIAGWLREHSGNTSYSRALQRSEKEESIC
jgi:hypothetical protein